MKRKAKNVTASIDLDLDLRMGGDEPLAVQMIDGKGGKAVPRISIAAYSGAAIRQWWSADPVVVSLAGMTLPKKHSRLVILRDHDMARPIGNATAIRKTDASLELDGDCTVPGDDTEQFVESSKNGFPWRASIGCGSLKVAYIDAGKQLTANGQTFSGPLTHVVSCELREVSVVTMGADDETDSVAATDDEKDKIMKRIRASADAGKPAPAAPPAVVAGDTAPTAPAAPATPPASGVQATVVDFTAERALRAAEATRVGAISAIAGITSDVCAQAIREGWAPERAELQVLRASRPQTPNVHIPGQVQMTDDLLSAALCKSVGIAAFGERPTDAQAKVLEASDKKFRSGIGLQQLIVMAAQQNGYSGSSFLRSGSDIRDALRAAFSTNTMASVLSNAANKMLLQAFMAVEQSWRMLAKINSNVQNFLQYDTYAFTGNLQFEQIAKDGEIPHGTLADTSYSNKLETYAKMMGITRQDIVNDDIGVLAQRAAYLGRGGGLALNVAFWTEFLKSHATFWTAARGNYISGAATTLASAGLATAHQTFRAQNGADGKPLGLTPKLLVVPSALEITAEELMTSTNVNTGGAATTEKVPNRNVFAGKYQVVASSYLGNATINATATALQWWLAADPLDMPVIEVGFLRGVTSPMVEEVAMDPHFDGIELRGLFDFGVRQQAYQAAVMSKGAA